MVRPFHFLKKLRDAIIVESRLEPHRKRRHFKRLNRLRLTGSIQTRTQKPVDRPLEGVARLTHLLLDQAGNIVIDGESCSHIMMLDMKAS